MRPLKPLSGTGYSESQIRRIRIDWEELSDAFRDDSDEHRYYLDRDTGAVHFFSQYLDNEEEEEDERQITAEERYVLIPHGRRLVPLEHLEDFVRRVDNDADRRRLRTALTAPEGQARFREVIDEAPSLQHNWGRFVRDGLQNRIKDWLAEVGVEPLE